MTKEKKSKAMKIEEGIAYYKAMYPEDIIVYNPEYKVFVSDQGRVFSRYKAFGEMKPYPSPNGYLKFKTTTIHKLVMKSFGMYIEGMEIDHISGDRRDCRLSNLRLVSHYQNIILRDMKNGGHGPMQGKRGSDHPRSKRIDQYDLYGNFIKTWNSQSEAAKELGLFQSSIALCCKGKLRQTQGYIFKFTEGDEN